MDTSKISDWLQIIASIGVVLGLLVVTYELRQNTAFAEAEHARYAYGMWIDVTSMELDSGIGEIVVRSVDDPNSLTKADKFNLSSWLVAIVTVYNHGDRALELGIASPQAGIIDADVRYFFASEYSREWFNVNTHWMRPRVAETIARVIDSTPIDTEWIPNQNYYGDDSIE